MSIGDVLKVVLSSRYLGIDCENIFHYMVDVSNGASESSGLGDGFGTVILTTIQAATLDEVEYLAISVTNLDNPVDTYLLAGLGEFGTVTGDATSAFMAWGFVMTTLDPAVGNGSKRFAGVAESAVTDGVANGSITTELATLATALASVVPAPGLATGEYLPAVASLDDTGALVAVGTIEAASYVRVTTQNSRKT